MVIKTTYTFIYQAFFTQIYVHFVVVQGMLMKENQTVAKYSS